MEKPKKKEIIAIIIISLLALFLQTYSLIKGIDHDDILNLRVITSSTESILKGEVIHPDQTPFHYIFMHFWIKIFGISELSLRMPSVVFGLLCIPSIYFLGRRLFNSKVGIVSAFLLSISIHLIENSRLFRMYSLFLLLSILSHYFFFTYLKNKDKKSLVSFTIISLINLYTHFFASFLLTIQILSYLIFEKKKSRGFFVSVALILIAGLPVITRMKEAFIFNKNDSICYPCNLFSMLNSIHYNFIQWVLFFILMTFFVFGLKVVYKENKKLSLISLIIFTFPLLVNFFARCILLFEVKHYLFILPIFVVIIANFLIKNNPRVRIILFSLILILSLFALMDYYSRPYGSDWKGASEYIKENFREGDIIATSDYAYGPISYYLYGAIKIPYYNPTQIQNYIGGYKRLWFVYHTETGVLEDDKLRTQSLIHKYLDNRYKKVGYRTYMGLPTLHDLPSSNLTIILYNLK